MDMCFLVSRKAHTLLKSKKKEQIKKSKKKMQNIEHILLYDHGIDILN